MYQIKHRVGIRTRVEKLYKLLTTDEGLARWWTTNTTGAGPVGSVIQFRFGDGGPDFEVTELVPNKLVRWKHSGTVPDAWVGSEICFQLDIQSDQIYLNFSHYNWSENNEFLAHCSTKWGIFMMSIKSCLETGIGQPFPNDVRIDFDE